MTRRFHWYAAVIHVSSCVSFWPHVVS